MPLPVSANANGLIVPAWRTLSVSPYDPSAVSANRTQRVSVCAGAGVTSVVSLKSSLKVEDPPMSVDRMVTEDAPGAPGFVSVTSASPEVPATTAPKSIALADTDTFTGSDTAWLMTRKLIST